MSQTKHKEPQRPPRSPRPQALKRRRQWEAMELPGLDFPQPEPPPLKRPS